MKLLDELHHRLGSRSRIRSLLKDVSIQEVKHILNRLKAIHEEKLASKVNEDEKKQKKIKDIATIQKAMAELGISLSDLNYINNSGVTGKRRRTATKHTFQYENSLGQTMKWRGSTTGRLPKEFQEYLEKTKKKRKQCIIE